MEDIKKIIATFLDVDSELINDTTIIDRNTIKGSILIHRMYAEIEKIGYKVDDYSNIRTVNDLFKMLGYDKVNDVPIFKEESELFNKYLIGIDIEYIEHLPTPDDFRDDTFYKMNFAEEEISYSLLQISPIQTFAGLFSAKEAISKTSQRFRGIPFNKIKIEHDKFGKPCFPEYQISISHSKNLVVAVAFKFNSVEEISTVESNSILHPISDLNTYSKQYFVLLVVSLLALLISIITFFLLLKNKNL